MVDPSGSHVVFRVFEVTLLALLRELVFWGLVGHSSYTLFHLNEQNAVLPLNVRRRTSVEVQVLSLDNECLLFTLEAQQDQSCCPRTPGERFAAVSSGS